MRLSVITVLFSTALVLNAPTQAYPSQTTQQAAGSYDNALIATTALKYVGQWGGDACADARRSGETASTSMYPSYPSGYSSAKPPTGKATIKPASGGDGQCRSFVNCVVWLASGKTQWIGLNPADYFYAFTHPSGGGPAGVEITNVADLKEGDIVQQGQTANAANLHTFIIVKPLGGSSFDVVGSNDALTEFVQKRHTTVALSSTVRAFRMGASPKTPAADRPLGLRLVYRAQDSKGRSGGRLTVEISGNLLYDRYVGAPILLITRDSFIGCEGHNRGTHLVITSCTKAPVKALKKYHGVYGLILATSDPFSPGAPTTVEKTTRVFTRTIGGIPSVCRSGPMFVTNEIITTCVSAADKFLTYHHEPPSQQLGNKYAGQLTIVSAERNVPVGPFAVPAGIPVK
jgi:hypothetical protein